LVNPTSTDMLSAAFTDNFPPGMTYFATVSNSCGGTLTDAAGGALAAGDTGIALTGGTIPVADCTIVITVKTNQTGANTIQSGGLTATTPSGASVSNGASATAVLTVDPPPAATKTFSPATVLECPLPCDAPTSDQISTLTITLSNTTSSIMTGVTFADILQKSVSAEMRVISLFGTSGGSGSPVVGAVCSGSITAQNDFDHDSNPATAAINHIATLISLTIPENGNCVITAQVIATEGATDYLNNTGDIAYEIPTDGDPIIGVGPGAEDTLTVMKPLLVEKFFSPNPIYTGQTSILTIRLTNLNPQTVTGISFTDTYPAGLENALPSSVTTNCGPGVVTGISGSDTVELIAGSVPPNGQFCEVTVAVVASALGDYPNTIPQGSVTTINAGTSPPADVVETLTVLDPPTVEKAFSPNPIPDPTLSTTSTMTITLSNPGSLPITGVSLTDFYPIGLFNASSPNAATTCGGLSTLTAAPNGTSISLIQGEIPAGGSCTITVVVTAPSVGSYLNSTGLVITGGPIGTAVCAVGGLPSATPCPATATLDVPVYVHGTVYNDANHNANLETGETGTGLTTLCAKLILGGVVVDVQDVDDITGAYTVSNPATGTYSVVIDSGADCSDLSNLDPDIPAGWIGTEAPTQVRDNIVVTINQKAVFDQDFGLFNGIKITGTVFKDDGVGGGTANDGVDDATGEVGLAGVVVQAKAAACLGTICDSTTTDASGNYALYVPASIATVGGVQVSIVETNLAGYISTGGSPGTTGGSYDRPTDTSTFNFTTAVIGTTYTDVDFGDVPVNTFATDGAQAALPGTVVFYAHIFTPGTAGSVTFGTADVPSPVTAGWSSLVYLDSNCDGTLGSGETTLLAGAVSTTPGVQICIVVKVAIPAGAPSGAQNATTVTAIFTYINDPQAPDMMTTHVLTDVTTVGAAGLTLQKEVDKATALPDDQLVYILTYTNNSSAPLDNIVVSDTTPAHTTFNSAACPVTLPPNITACAVTTAPALGGTGAVVWTLTGQLAPGAFGTVTYTVTVD